MARSPLQVWPWHTLRSFDSDIRELNQLIRSWTGPQCDRNGVLTLRPNYHLEQMNNVARMDVDLPGVSKEAVSVEVHGHRLRIVAAKYSYDSRSHLCSRARRHAKENQTQQAISKPLPSLVYRLEVRLSSRANLDAISASYKGAGVLRVTIPILESDQVRKITVNSDLTDVVSS